MNYKVRKTRFRQGNVLGLPGHVFGRHWHEGKGNRVSGDYDRQYAIIGWPKDIGAEGVSYLGHEKGEPLILPRYMNWPMSSSTLAVVESGTNFPILGHVEELVDQTAPRKPVVLDWGCGEGKMVKELALATKGRALIYAYANLWDYNWNDADGVKFLFFVKEHLPEYFRRIGRAVDFIFTHGAMDYLEGQELVEHLKSLAPLMQSGALIVFSVLVCGRPEFSEVSDLFELSPGLSQSNESDSPCFLTRR